MPLLERSFRCRSIFRAAILGLALAWLSYVYWAGPIYEGKRLRFWVQSAIEKCEVGDEDMHDELAAIQSLAPDLGAKLLERIPELSDSDTPSPLARLALALPPPLREKVEFSTPARRKAAVIILASRLIPQSERAFQTFWASGHSASEEVRLASSQAVARLGRLQEHQTIRLLRSDPWELRQVGFWSCMAFKDAALAVPYIERSVERGEHDRYAALRLAARIGEPAWHVLERALASTNPIIAQPAIIGVMNAPRTSTFPERFGPLLLEHARKPADPRRIAYRHATQALGRLDTLTPEIRALLAEALSTDPAAWGHDAVAALERSRATPAEKAAVLALSMEEASDDKIPLLVERIAKLAHTGAINPGEADALGEKLVQAYERLNVRRMPMALPLAGTLAPRNERVQAYLSAMTRARDNAIVTRALWGLARTELAADKKLEIARRLLADPNPPPALLYLLGSIGDAAAPLIVELEQLASAPQNHGFAAAARKFLNDRKAGETWDGKIAVGASSGSRQYPELAGVGWALQR